MAPLNEHEQRSALPDSSAPLPVPVSLLDNSQQQHQRNHLGNHNPRPHKHVKTDIVHEHQRHPRSNSLPWGLPLIPPSSPPGSGLRHPASPHKDKYPSVPFLPPGSHGLDPIHYPPSHNQNEFQKAMDEAVKQERQRRMEREAEEKDLSADELRCILREERLRMSKMASDNARLKVVAVQCTMESEVMEEGRINTLMRRLENLQFEKGRIINELEREEEMVSMLCCKTMIIDFGCYYWLNANDIYCCCFTQVTNTLQKKLQEVRREKAILEGIISQEQLDHAQLETKLADIHQVAELDPMKARETKPVMPLMVAVPESTTESEEDDDVEDLEREDHMEEEP